MKNFPVKVNGKEYWVCRALATLVFIFRNKDNKMQVLIEKRGKGLDSEVGKWCCPCGYLDYDETLEDCIVRECKEEVGFDIKEEKLNLIRLNSDPKADKRQTVSVHYIYYADENEDYSLSKRITGGEKNEIEKVEWMDIGEVNGKEINVDIYKLYEKDFAFNHGQLIIEYLSRDFKLNYKN